MDATRGTATSNIGQLLGELSSEVDGLAETLTERIIATEQRYLEDTPANRHYLYDACRTLLSTILFQLGAAQPADLESAGAAGRLRAEQGIPLATVLRCYRFAVQLVWEEFAARANRIPPGELIEFTTAAWALVDRMSDALTTGYRDTERALIRADAETRARHIRELFDTRTETPARAMEALRALDLPEQGSYTVLATEIEPGRPENTAAATQSLRQHSVTAVWETREDVHLGLACGRSPDEIISAVTGLATLFPGRTGASQPFSAPQRIADAVGEARLALRCRPPGIRTVTWYGADPIPLLLVQLPAAARRTAARILGPLREIPDIQREELLTTLRAWFDHGGSNPAVARQLHCHRNTILYRLHKIRDLTGRDCDNPVEAAELYIALQAEQLLGQ
ncbi:PucR family transcriptional regulator [Nocardia sp. NPDC058058]|uniref:PucR family transcriptional regulator n=1 Tax=Nocardia sp. NPDC058058 TaxID=3346317 RepID=UPI0036DBAB10